MNFKLMLTCCFLTTSLFLSQTMNAQFFKYLTKESNYLRGDVKNEASGLTFTYRLQDDSTLVLKTLLIHTDNNGEVQWTKEPSSNFASYTIAPNTSVILTGSKLTTEGNRLSILQKQDKNGNVVWSKTLKVPSADIGIGNIMFGPNNMIFATLTRSSFSSSTYYSKSAIVAYDMDGQLLWINHFSNGGFTSEYSF